MIKLPDKRILLIFFCYLLFFILIPPFQIPDEPGHYENIFWVAHSKYPYAISEEGKDLIYSYSKMAEVYSTKQIVEEPFTIPNFEKIKESSLRQQKYYSDKEMASFSQISPQAGQSPLYYLLGSIFFRLADLLNLDLISHFYLVRYLSALFYFGVVFLAYRILCFLLKNENVVKNLLLFFSLNPLLLEMGVGINHDISLVFFSLLFLLLLLRSGLPKKLSFSNVFLLASTSAAAVLAKISGIFTFIAFSFLVFSKEKLVKTLAQISRFSFVLLTFLLPWFFFNYQRYSVPIRTFTSYRPQEVLVPQSISRALLLALLEFRHTVMHFSGFMGWNNVYPFKWFFYGYFVIFILLLLLGLTKVIKKRTSATDSLTVYTLSLFFFLFVYAFGFKKIGLSWDIQGRYLLPVFLPIVYFIAGGLSLLLQRKIEVASKILALFAIFHFNFILFFVLIARYYV